MKLKNKIAVITGGNSGIGLATARCFKEEGASLVIFGRNRETVDAAVNGLGENCLGLVGDVSKLTDIQKLMDTVQEHFGRIDVLFCNAGIAKFLPVSDFTEELFDELYGVHFKGAFFTLQKALPLLSKGATVIFVSSSTAGIKGMPLNGIYDANKAAISALTRSMQVELMDKGIRINCLRPGLTHTPILSRDIGISAEVRDQIAQNVTEQIPVGRLGTAEEMAKAALFLASDDSSYMYGQELSIDGGLTL